MFSPVPIERSEHQAPRFFRWLFQRQSSSLVETILQSGVLLRARLRDKVMAAGTEVVRSLDCLVLAILEFRLARRSSRLRGAGDAGRTSALVEEAGGASLLSSLRLAGNQLHGGVQTAFREISRRLPGQVQDLLEHRLVKRGARMLTWRISAMLFTSIGTIWTARCLGPANLGISGFIQTGMAQAVLLIWILPESFLIRAYKLAATDLERRELLELATTMRVVLASGIAFIALLAGLLIDLPDNWRLSYFCGLPVLLVTALNIAWLMQAKEDQPAQYRAQFYTAIVTTTLSLVLLRPGAVAGADMVVAAISGIASCAIMWRCAGEGQFWRYVRRFDVAVAWNIFRDGRIVYITGIVIYLTPSLSFRWWAISIRWKNSVSIVPPKGSK